MGRYPFLEIGRQYLERRKPHLAESTYNDLKRKVPYLNSVFVMLKKEGLVTTTNPAKMVREDIGALEVYMRSEIQEKGWSKGAKRKQAGQNYLVNLLQLLKKVCLFAGNNVFAQMEAEGENLFQKIPKDLSSLTQEELARLAVAAESIGGWTGEVARFLVAIYPYTGLRYNELRLEHLEDLNTSKWTVWVRHPKGERRYGRQRTSYVAPPARPAILRYLAARQEHLRSKGVESTVALIPAWQGGKFDFYSPTHLRRIKAMIEKRTSATGPIIRFHIKTFRDTYVQMNIDLDPTLLSPTSVTSGHATSRTTETSYGRMRAERALDSMRKAWEPDAVPKPVTPLNGKKFDITGYG